MTNSPPAEVGYFPRGHRAIISYFRDVLGCFATIFFLIAWISDIQEGKANYTSTSYFEEGFCISPHMNTHLVCASFDILCGLMFLCFKNKKVSIPFAAYLISHGYGHYEAGTTDKPLKYREIGLEDVIIISAILSIGPLTGAKAMFNVGYENKKAIYACACLATLVLTLVYKFVIGQANYSLAYINISIMITSVFPRALFIGWKNEKDIRFRVDANRWFWMKQASSIFVISVIVAEPFLCDAFVSKIGGHLLFDASLLIDTFVDYLNSDSFELGTISHKDKEN